MPPYNPLGVAGKMPMKGRRPSATKTTHTAVPQVDAEQANVEDFAPPEWRTVLNNRADLGESTMPLPFWASLTCNRFSRLLSLSTWVQSNGRCIDRGECQKWVLGKDVCRDWRESYSLTVMLNAEHPGGKLLHAWTDLWAPHEWLSGNVESPRTGDCCQARRSNASNRVSNTSFMTIP